MIAGIHVSTTGGMEKAPGRLRELGLKAGQIFTANQRRWSSAPLFEKRIEAFREQAGDILFVSHASYLINPASAREDVREKSERAIADELNRCSLLGIPLMVIHPGAHQKAGLQRGIALVAMALAKAVEDTGEGPLILLENTAGAGTTIGTRFEELVEIRDRSGVPERIGFCIDTAHAHGAGYKVGTGAFMEEMVSVLGVKNIRAFHLNGSKVERGSLRDRHEHYGMGFISSDALRALFHSSYFNNIPGIAETPGEDADRAEDIRSIRGRED